MHAFIWSKLHSNLCKNSCSLDHLKTLQKPPYNQTLTLFLKSIWISTTHIHLKIPNYKSLVSYLAFRGECISRTRSCFFCIFFSWRTNFGGVFNPEGHFTCQPFNVKGIFWSRLSRVQGHMGPSNWRQATCLQYVPSQNRKGCFELLWMITISVVIFVVDDPNFNYIRKFIKNTQTHTLNPKP